MGIDVERAYGSPSHLGQRWFSGIALATLISILVGFGYHVHKAGQREREFLARMDSAQKIEYIPQPGDMLNSISNCEGLTLEQREMYKDYLIKLYPKLEKNIPAGDTPQRFLLPDYNGDHEVGCQK